MSLGTRTHAASDMAHYDDYTNRRFRILFEVWLPGKSEATFESKLCETCGMVIYTPRPTPEEVNEGYRYLLQMPVAPGQRPVSEEVQSVRAKDLFRIMSRYARGGAARVLDFGGGRGQLMTCFADLGCDCFVVDYYPNPIPKVRKLGNTLDELPKNMKFDVVICSHVLERLADPLSVLVQLRSLLSESGILYVEVPMELWRCVPVQARAVEAVNPIDHLNFFTVQPLRFLLERASFSVISCSMDAYVHTNGSRLTAVRAVARASNKVRTRYPDGAARATERIICPDLRLRVQMLAIHPDWLWAAGRSRLIRVREYFARLCRRVPFGR
ncbi:MAG: class I SAM-dependent methyltransferase [Candidatus Hydrogenedentes bacterium]|nr:class I SAM-dependent methyltransferase [Candidatus Hydrogenedentota bacterium]